MPGKKSKKSQRPKKKMKTGEMSEAELERTSGGLGAYTPLDAALGAYTPLDASLGAYTPILAGVTQKPFKR